MQTEPAPHTVGVTEHIAPPEGKKCPYCAEIIKPDAIKCRFCGSNLAAGASRAQADQPAPSARFIIGAVFFCVLVGFMAFSALSGWEMVDTGRLGPIVPAWNSLLTAGMLAVVIGLFRRANWAHDWATGTSGLIGISSLLSFKEPIEQGNSVLLAVLGMQVVGAAICYGCLAGIAGEFADPVHASDGSLIIRKSKMSIWITIGLIVGSLIVSAIGKK